MFYQVKLVCIYSPSQKEKKTKKYNDLATLKSLVLWIMLSDSIQYVK